MQKREAHRPSVICCLEQTVTTFVYHCGWRSGAQHCSELRYTSRRDLAGLVEVYKTKEAFQGKGF